MEMRKAFKTVKNYGDITVILILTFYHSIFIMIYSYILGRQLSTFSKFDRII